MSETIALLALGATLAAAVAQWRCAPDWVVAGLAAGVVVVATTFTLRGAGHALLRLAPTVGFLAALLVLADGARRAGVFTALGAVMARGARGRPRRLLGMVVVVASATTAILSLDSTIVLLTPIVLATAARLRADPRAPVLAVGHLANSASLLLPVSNLTNLLAFAASGLSFPRFASLMVLPWLVAIAVEWVVIGRLRSDGASAHAGSVPAAPEPAASALASSEAAPASAVAPEPLALPRTALGIIALTLAGFALSSAIGVAPVWFATAGALAMTMRFPPQSPHALARAAEPGFLVFVLALGIVVAAAGDGGLSAFVRDLLPDGQGLGALLAIAGIGALAANALNNLPATLILLPALAGAGPVPILALLIGVGVGPNLTYVGSLATLLWRRVLHEHDTTITLGEFLRLGAITVPVSLLACTLALWVAARVL